MSKSQTQIELDIPPSPMRFPRCGECGCATGAGALGSGHSTACSKYNHSELSRSIDLSKLPKGKTKSKGVRYTTSEYGTYQLDQHGDVLDIEHFDDPKDALDAAKRGVEEKGWAAAAVEFCTRRYPSHFYADPVTYKEIAAFGDKSALELFGWENIK